MFSTETGFAYPPEKPNSIRMGRVYMDEWISALGKQQTATAVVLTLSYLLL